MGKISDVTWGTLAKKDKAHPRDIMQGFLTNQTLP